MISWCVNITARMPVCIMRAYTSKKLFKKYCILILGAYSAPTSLLKRRSNMDFPCTQAMVSNVSTIKPNQTVAEALAVFKEKNIRIMPTAPQIRKFIKKNKEFKEMLPIGVRL